MESLMKQPKLGTLAYRFLQLLSCRSPPPDAEPSHLQDLGTTLATQSSQNKAPGLGRACCSNGFLANGLHALVIIVLSGEDFAIWVIPGKVARIIVTVRVTLSERVPDTGSKQGIKESGPRQESTLLLRRSVPQLGQGRGRECFRSSLGSKFQKCLSQGWLPFSEQGMWNSL